MAKRKNPLGTLLTIDEAEALTGVAARTLRYACKKELLPSIMVGGSYLIEKVDAKFFEKNRPKPGVKPKS